MSLAELQALFWQAVRADRPPPGLRAAVVDRAPLGAVHRMEIYRRAYWARHEKCLQETYERVLSIVGERTFRELVASYIAAHPSHFACIEWAGRAFPEHLRAQRLPGHDSELLAELAELEWASIEVWMAADAPSRLAPNALAAPDAPSRRLRMSPSLRLVRARPAALSLLRTAGAQPDADVAQDAASGHIAVWRGSRGIRSDLLPQQQARALELAIDGAPLATVCAEFEEPDAIERAVRALSEWMEQAWVIGLEGDDAM